jgi:hypothetical protein
MVFVSMRSIRHVTVTLLCGFATVAAFAFEVRPRAGSVFATREVMYHRGVIHYT